MSCKDCGDLQALTQEQIRAHIQPCGAGKNNPIFFAGIDYDEVQITDSTDFLSGTREAIRRHDPRRTGQYYKKGERTTPPGDNTITVEFAECCGDIPRHELIKDSMTLYEMNVCCNTDPTDLVNGWVGGNLTVYPNIRLSERRRNARVSFGDSNDVTATYSGTMDQSYKIGEMKFVDIADGLGADRIRDAIMIGNDSCGGGDCGETAESCTDRIYAVDRAGNFICKIADSPAVITAIPGIVSPVSVINEGNYIYVLDIGGSYFFTNLDSAGKPTTWNQSADPVGTHRHFINCERGVISVGDISGDAAIWKITGTGARPSLVYNADTNAGLIRADCCGKTVISVGFSGLIITSNDYGSTFGPAPTSPTTDTITAIHVHDENSWDIGTATGEYWCTRDGGSTWQQTNYGAPLANITDICYANSEVGMIVGTGGLYTTFTGGELNTWASDESARIPQAINSNLVKCHWPCCGNKTCQVNNVLIAGFTGVTGELWVGQPS